MPINANGIQMPQTYSQHLYNIRKLALFFIIDFLLARLSFLQSKNFGGLTRARPITIFKKSDVPRTDPLKLIKST